MSKFFRYWGGNDRYKANTSWHKMVSASTRLVEPYTRYQPYTAPIPSNTACTLYWPRYELVLGQYRPCTSQYCPLSIDLDFVLTDTTQNLNVWEYSSSAPNNLSYTMGHEPLKTKNWFKRNIIFCKIGGYTFVEKII